MTVKWYDKLACQWKECKAVKISFGADTAFLELSDKTYLSIPIMCLMYIDV